MFGSKKCVLWLGGDNETDGCVLSLSRGEEEHLDVDIVHAALREFQQELRDTQRERVKVSVLIGIVSLKLSRQIFPINKLQ